MKETNLGSLAPFVKNSYAGQEQNKPGNSYKQTEYWQRNEKYKHFQMLIMKEGWIFVCWLWISLEKMKTLISRFSPINPHFITRVLSAVRISAVIVMRTHICSENLTSNADGQLIYGGGEVVILGSRVLGCFLTGNWTETNFGDSYLSITPHFLDIWKNIVPDTL